MNAEIIKKPPEEYEYKKIKVEGVLLARCYSFFAGEDFFYVTDAPSLVGFVGYTKEADDGIPVHENFTPKMKFVKIKKTAC